MNCEKCSTELPPYAVACYRCGTMTGNTYVVPPRSIKTNKAPLGMIASFVVLAVIAVAAIAVAAVAIITHSRPSGTAAITPPAQSTPTQSQPTTRTEAPPAPAPPPKQSVKIVNEARQIAAGTIWATAFTMPTDGQTKGGFVTTTGGSKDIDAYIVDETNYALLQGGQAFRAIVMRLKSERGSLNANLSAGRYFLVFSNKHAFWYSKEVATEMDIIF